MFRKIGDAVIASDRVLALQPRSMSNGKDGVEITFDNGQWLIVTVADPVACIENYQALGTGTTAG